MRACEIMLSLSTIKDIKKLLPDIFSDLVSISMSHEGEIKLDDSFMKPKSVSRRLILGFHKAQKYP